ncbi:hypothetical protein BDV93DRAFT_612378 [Ceratobasidium sp. AG-I]|nr:hypothetical protein BDV93DRAFT_612378 [Ceratobasidium sp. AG-I]
MSTTAAQASRKVFETPELLSLICSSLSQRALHIFIRANKSGFLAAVPFLWEKVKGVVQLLKLLPMIGTIRNQHLGIGKIVLPLSQSNFARFEFYARFVKGLEIYEEDCFVDIGGLEVLTLKREQGSLLPNLSSLTASLHSPSLTCFAQGQALIISLLSPSLKYVRVTGTRKIPGPACSTLVGSAIMAAITKICPEIRVISLFPSASSKYVSEVEPPLSSSLHNLSHQCLAALCSLCEFETSTAIVRPEALAMLGELPQLKHLALCAPPDEPPVRPFDLLDHAFPSLEFLALKGLRSTEVEMLLSLLSLVRNINTLEVVANLGENEERWSLDEFFPCLNNMPRLTNLSATFNDSWTEEEPPDINFPPVLSTLSKLPLLAIYLSGVEFREYINFTKIFPTLTKLDISGQNVGLEYLAALSTIPKLEHLVLSLDLEGEELDPLEGSVFSCQSLHTIEIVDLSSLLWRPKWVYETVEYLITLFPNIEQVVSSCKAKSRSPDKTDGITWLNSQIGMQQKLKKLRSCIVDKYGQDEADSLIPASFPANLFE